MKTRITGKYRLDLSVTDPRTATKCLRRSLLPIYGLLAFQWLYFVLNISQNTHKIHKLWCFLKTRIFKERHKIYIFPTNINSNSSVERTEQRSNNILNPSRISCSLGCPTINCCRNEHVSLHRNKEDKLHCCLACHIFMSFPYLSDFSTFTQMYTTVCTLIYDFDTHKVAFATCEGALAMQVCIE